MLFRSLPFVSQSRYDAPELAIIEAIMQEYNVSENIAMAMREAEQMGADDEEIMSLANRLGQLEATNA